MRLWSRNGRDWSREFLAVSEALRGLKAKEIVLDGEAMAHCKNGLPDFFGLRSEDGGAAACLFAFDLLRIDGEDLRPLPLEDRRARLRKALVAFMVAPDWQGAGLGTVLQTRLQEYAISRGVRGFIAEILPRNSRMLKLATHASGAVKTSRDEDAVHVTITFEGQPESADLPPAF